MTELEPFGTIKMCPACDARESWGDGISYATYPYPIREFKREFKSMLMFCGKPSYIVSTCWRCGYAWHELALHRVEENNEDQTD